jgi:hypothetical protein
MIEQGGLNKTLIWIRDNMTKTAAVIKDGLPVSIPINKKEIVGDTLSVYLLVDNTYSSKLTDYQLIDKDGSVFARMADDVQKPAKHLYLITFQFRLSEVFAGV